MSHVDTLPDNSQTSDILITEHIVIKLLPIWFYAMFPKKSEKYWYSSENTVEPRNNSPAFKGSPSIKVNILRSQMVVVNVISPLFKG